MSERIASHSIEDLILGKKEPVFLSGFGEVTVIRPKTPADMVDVSGLLDDHYTNRITFNHAVITFGRIFEQMKRSSITAGKRWGINQPVPEGITLISCDQAMDNMTLIANLPEAYGNLELKEKYRKNLGRVLKVVESSGLLNPEATKIAVKRAGVIVAGVLHGLNAALVYEAKRLPFVDNTLGVGMEDQDKVLTPENLHHKDVEIDEVFLASGSTILAFMADSYSRSIKPRSLTIVAPFTTQQGAEAVLTFSEQLGWDTRIVASRLYYAMNEKWYVLVTPEEKVWQEVTGGDSTIEVQAGGDAGDLTEL